MKLSICLNYVILYLEKQNVREWDLSEIDNEDKRKIKRSMKTTNVKEGNGNCVLVNAKHILWVCPLAMNKQQKCTYCKCHNCFKNTKMFSSQSRVTRGNRSSNCHNSIDDNKKVTICGGHSDHTLQAWTDSLFFTKQYKLNNKRKNIRIYLSNAANATTI